jgi:multisubunit Na+/H+ antiporter MnhB subunit
VAVAAAVVAVVAALAAFVASEPPHSTPTRWAVVAVVLAAVVLAIALGWGRQRERSGVWLAAAFRSIGRWRQYPARQVLGVTIWLVIILAIAAFDFASFLHQSHDLPTLSYYIGKVTRYSWVRGLCVVAWLAVGGWILTTERRPRS